jgi:hypothetical protein
LIGFDADENGQSRQAQHQIPIAPVLLVLQLLQIHTGPIEIGRRSTGFGSSSARSRPFELIFWYVFLETIIVLG